METMSEKSNVQELEKKLKEAYEQIGKKYYEKMQGRRLEDDSYQELFVSVKKIRETLEENDLIKQGKKRCTNCRHIVPVESKFCNMCGAKFAVEKENTPPSVPKCPDCGYTLEEDAVFCPNCGRKKV